ncbi:hypothetical protein X729_10170 [Mesorhizobium sp. L103C131B0]|nr:hypothetical protein X729_10170 [Mesorhizobium sp. L103C131B0]
MSERQFSLQHLVAVETSVQMPRLPRPKATTAIVVNTGADG